MMEASGGASITDVRARDGKRQSVFRAYVFPYMDRPNLTVLSEALVTQVIFDGKRATGWRLITEEKPNKFARVLKSSLRLAQSIHRRS